MVSRKKSCCPQRPGATTKSRKRSSSSRARVAAPAPETKQVLRWRAAVQCTRRSSPYFSVADWKLILFANMYSFSCPYGGAEMNIKKLWWYQVLAVVAVHDHLSVSWSQVSKKPTRERWYYDIMMFFVWCKGGTNILPFPLIFVSSAFSACRRGVLSAHFLCRLHFGKSQKQIAHTSKSEVDWIWYTTC